MTVQLMYFIRHPSANWPSAHGWANLVKVGPTLMARGPRSKYACTRVENEIRALVDPDEVHYLISTILVRYWYIIYNRTLELKISYSLLGIRWVCTLLMSNLFVSGNLISYGFKIFPLSMTELNFYKTQYFCMKLGKNSKAIHQGWPDSQFESGP